MEISFQNNEGIRADVAQGRAGAGERSFNIVLNIQGGWGGIGNHSGGLSGWKLIKRDGLLERENRD